MSKPPAKDNPSDGVDAVELCADLVRCESVTPNEGGALRLIEPILTNAGFTCTRIDRGGVCNLFARWGENTNAPIFGFNGHTDVVPIGDAAAWTVPPFGAVIKDGVLYGRGAADMKSGVAAFCAAAIDFVKTTPKGAVVITLTGDEEGPAEHGTRAILDWMNANGERMDHCLVGEPTCPETMGDMMKIGRRGSVNATITARGVQGHVGYPDKAKNPMPALVGLLGGLCAHRFDDGNDYFQPTRLEITAINTDNLATNITPASAVAKINLRFNDAHTSDSLIAWLNAQLQSTAKKTGIAFDLQTHVTGESFLTPPSEFSDLIAAAVKAETGITPTPSTTGGTSDARFITHHCPVVEFGLVGKTMHQVDERVSVDHIRQLKAIYLRILQSYFS